jgi:hypothetical protein
MIFAVSDRPFFFHEQKPEKVIVEVSETFF